MITGTIKTQVDSIWNAFWSGGISNPMEVIEQRAVCGEGRRSGMFIEGRLNEGATPLDSAKPPPALCAGGLARR